MDAMRDQRGVPSVEHLVRDLRYSWRALRRNPWFTGIATAMLVIGVGGNTAIFAVIQSVILRPLDYPESDRLVHLSTRVPQLGYAEFWVSPPEYFEFQELNRSFSEVGAYRPFEANVVANGDAIRVRSVLVDHHLLTVLGLHPVAGRVLTSDEAANRGTPVAMLSHELWRSAFGGAPLVGQVIEVDGIRREVIAIMPPGADVMDAQAQIWLPLGIDPANRQNRGTHFLHLVGRLAPGIDLESARRELDELMANWATLAGVSGTGVAGHVFAPVGKPAPPGVATPGHVMQMQDARSRVLGTAPQSLWVVQAGVALLLAMVCVNAGSLFLARAEMRRRELALRAALGASRGRLIQAFVLESLSITALGAIGGVLIARAAIAAIPRLYPGGLPRSAEITLDAGALAFAVALSLAITIGLSLTPLFTLRRSNLIGVIDHSRQPAATSRVRVRQTLMVTQVALAVVVTIAAGLLYQTVRNLTNEDGGFARTQLHTFSVSPTQARYLQPFNRLALYRDLLARIDALPGVESTTAMSGLPLSRPPDPRGTDIEGYTPTPDGPPEMIDYYQATVPGYFDTMGIPIVRGRGFVASDADATAVVAVVNESLANLFWRGRDPIGQRLRPCCGDDVPWLTIVGVARDVKQERVNKQATSELYYLIDQAARRSAPPATMNIVVRAAIPAATLEPMIAAAVREVEASLPIIRFRTMDEVFEDSIQRPRVLADSIGLLAAIALLLSAIGVYGLIACLVAERRVEFGIRRALGATPGQTIIVLITQATQIAVVGSVIGVAAAAGLNQLLQATLFGVQPLDALTYVLTVVAILAVVALACVLPAWRALAIEPRIVLRDS
jgi:putative ABC transport system permease protein